MVRAARSYSATACGPRVPYPTHAPQEPQNLDHIHARPNDPETTRRRGRGTDQQPSRRDPGRRCSDGQADDLPAPSRAVQTCPITQPIMRYVPSREPGDAVADVQRSGVEATVGLLERATSRPIPAAPTPWPAASSSLARGPTARRREPHRLPGAPSRGRRAPANAAMVVATVKRAARRIARPVGARGDDPRPSRETGVRIYVYRYGRCLRI